METRLEASLLKSRNCVGRLSSKRLLSVYNKVTKVISVHTCKAVLSVHSLIGSVKSKSVKV